MTLFVQNNATGAGAGTVNGAQGGVDLGIIANGDVGFGLAAAVGNRQQVTYAPTMAGVPLTRLNTLVNTNFNPNYGLGVGPQAVPIVVLPVGANFTRNDGALITTIAGFALPPQNSGLAGANLNNTNDCLVVYDTSNAGGNGYCVARLGGNGAIDLNFPTAAILYHELSHALRIVNNGLLNLTNVCNPASAEENAAIVDENDVRTQMANAVGNPVVLRDPQIHCGNPGPCGGCCIVASVASGSPISEEVRALRALRDGLVRRTEIGFAFFETFFYDYYGFSPQVCTLMASRPELSALVLNGFVRPLIVALRILEHHSLVAPPDVVLGELVARVHPDREEAAVALATLDRARSFWDGQMSSDDAVACALAGLLRDRARPSEHVTWALIEPLRIYGHALRSHVEGADPESLGCHLRRAFDEWAIALPLDHVWGSLSADQLERELGFYESRLLRSPPARERFHERLLERFGELTAVQAVLGRERLTAGGAR